MNCFFGVSFFSNSTISFSSFVNCFLFFYPYDMKNISFLPFWKQFRISLNCMEKINKTEDEWKAELTTQTFQVLRKHGTERAFSGEYNDHHDDGTYVCAGCGNALFDSKVKFNSGTGWPSFYEPITPDAVETTTDTKFFMTRTEVHCAKCDGHLGHVFTDGPMPTGMRYCMNSVSLKFQKEKI